MRKWKKKKVNTHMMKIKMILMAAVAAAAACGVRAEVFHDGDTVVFFGDSITHAGFYHEYIADYYRTRFPDASIRIVNSGVGGDNASAAASRIDVDVAEYKPTHVAFHFGMNDVGRGNYDAAPSARQLEACETAQENFRRNLPALVGKVKEAVPGVKAIYLTPTPYDDTAVPTNIPSGATGWAVKNNKGCNTGLSLFAGYVLVSAKRDGVLAVDWFTPLNNFLMSRRANDPHFMVTSWDRVHPGPLGHAIMAWQFLISQGVPAVVSDVCVDAANGRVARSENATVSDVTATNGCVSFTLLAKSLPFPVPHEAAGVLDEFKVEDRLNRETLAVKGLKEGDYALLIDGEKVGTWSAAEFARGIRLGFNAKTPQFRQARAVFDSNAKLSSREREFRNYHASRWFYGKKAPVDDVEAFGKWYEENVKNRKMYYAQFVPGYLKYWPTYKEARAKLWADQEAVRALAKPVPRRYEVAAVPAEAALSAEASCKECELSSKCGIKQSSCDVLVVGGGPAGIGAAGEAARAGASTILLEQGFQVGGTMTSGLVHWPGLFFAYGKLVVGGFGWETVSNALAEVGDPLPPYAEWRTRRHSEVQPCVNVSVYVALCEEMLRKAGVVIRYYSSPAALVRRDGAWHVTVHSGGDTRVIVAREIVDCTGSGSVAALAGAELMDSEERMPGDYRFRCSNVPPREKWDVPAMQKAYREAIADGSLKEGDTRDKIFGYKYFTGLFTNYLDTRGEGTDGRGDVNMAGRAAMLRLFRFLRRQPGFEKLCITSHAAEAGVRETTRVRGDYVITLDDYVTGRVWPDSLCYVFYPVDMHVKGKGVVPQELPVGVVPTVPLRALLPKGIDHMLMAGRCLSADRQAMSGIRVQAACMATGQAAGEAAAIAARKGCAPRKLDPEEIKAGLRSHGCIVP